MDVIERSYMSITCGSWKVNNWPWLLQGCLIKFILYVEMNAKELTLLEKVFYGTSVYILYWPPAVMEKYFLPTKSIQYQADKRWEVRKISISGILFDLIINSQNLIYKQESYLIDLQSEWVFNLIANFEDHKLSELRWRVQYSTYTYNSEICDSPCSL